MKSFLDDDFLLHNDTARELYHGYASGMPIIDYHNHLSPKDIAENRVFSNLTQIWLEGDHYKWRAMRTNGIAEFFITGTAGDWEKFEKWAQTVPYTLRNPLFHWTHLELKRYFGISDLLTEKTARRIYESATEKLQDSDFSTRRLLEKINVRVLCTTDDPLDDLRYHQQLKNEQWEVSVFPAFRPDKAMQVEDPIVFNQYLNALEKVANISISNFNDFLNALKSRHDFFFENNCSLSDHGLEELYTEEFSSIEIAAIFLKIRENKPLDPIQIRKFKSSMLLTFAEWDWEKGFVQQFHLGAIRNNNSRMMKLLGPDTGWDSIGDFSHAQQLSRFLDKLDRNNTLAKTIIYNLNPADNEVFASMIGNFNDGSVAAKIQWGSAWWFLDQKDGIISQINSLSNMGLLSRFVGMLTDSRSFLSFPRHEYFRRIMCNMLGDEIEKGELPNDLQLIGNLVQDVSFNNAKNYFNWPSNN